jgi:hypothetical protein
MTARNLRGPREGRFGDHCDSSCSEGDGARS